MNLIELVTCALFATQTPAEEITREIAALAIHEGEPNTVVIDGQEHTQYGLNIITSQGRGAVYLVDRNNNAVPDDCDLFVLTYTSPRQEKTLFLNEGADKFSINNTSLDYCVADSIAITALSAFGRARGAVQDYNTRMQEIYDLFIKKPALPLGKIVVENNTG